jgi:hypothetical protein
MSEELDGASEGDAKSGLGAGASDDGASAARDLPSTSAAMSRASAAKGATVTAARRSTMRNMARAIVGLVWLGGAVALAMCANGSRSRFVLFAFLLSYDDGMCRCIFFEEKVAWCAFL